MKQSLKKNWYIWILFIVAIGTRFLFIKLRPPHFDEGINGFFVDQMWAKGFFDYDPTNYHGPLHFYFLQLFEIIFGRGIDSFRYLTATISLGTLALILMHQKYIGRAALWAAIIFVLSPGALFYSRYAIHEVWIPFSLVLFSYGFIRWFSEKDNLSQFCVFAGISIAFLNKETAGIHFFAFVIALVYLLSFHKDEINKKSLPSFLDILVGMGWVLISLYIVYSSFGLMSEQFIDFFKGFLPWLKTGTEGNGHQKPFGYWLQVAWENELWFLVSIVIGIMMFSLKNKWLNFFFINALVTLLVYSLIPYKTPWCMISIFTYMPFVLGLGLDLAPKLVRNITFSLFALLMGVQTYRLIDLNYFSYANEDEKYVYVHTTKDYFKIVNPLKKLIQEKPELKNMGILIQMASPWPITWELSKLTNLRYNPRDADFLNTPFILIDENAKDSLEPQLRKKYHRFKFKFRYSMADVYVYFQSDVFRDYVTGGEMVGPET